MKANIKVMEKPDWISWDKIHEAIWKAHENNREKGVYMKYPTWSGLVIEEKLKDGKMLVATDGTKLVGTAGVKLKKRASWYGNGTFAYCFLDSVLPDYNGFGIYKQLSLKREELVKELGITRLFIDTHENNNRELAILKKNGYQSVDYRFYNDHYNVVLVKWLDGCPFRNYRLGYEYAKRKVMCKMKIFWKNRIVSNGIFR